MARYANPTEILQVAGPMSRAITALRHMPSRNPPLELLRGFGLGALTILVLSSLIAAAYLVKSALGIDVLPGPSPLHDVLFPLLGRS